MISPNKALDSPDADQKMARLLIIFEADSYAEVKALVKNDIYWTGDVVCIIQPLSAWVLTIHSGIEQWDKEKTAIHPWVTAKVLL